MKNKERRASVVLDHSGKRVIEVEVMPSGRAAVRFEAAGLWFDISSICNGMYERETFRQKCEFKVRQQLQWYCDSDDVMHRRAGHMLWATESAPIHSVVHSRMSVALEMWHKLRLPQ